MLWSPLVPEHRAEGGGGELETGAPGETAASGQGPVSTLQAATTRKIPRHTPKYHY